MASLLTFYKLSFHLFYNIPINKKHLIKNTPNKNRAYDCYPLFGKIFNLGKSRYYSRTRYGLIATWLPSSSMSIIISPTTVAYSELLTFSVRPLNQ